MSHLTEVFYRSTEINRISDKNLPLNDNFIKLTKNPNVVLESIQRAGLENIKIIKDINPKKKIQPDTLSTIETNFNILLKPLDLKISMPKIISNKPRIKKQKLETAKNRIKEMISIIGRSIPLFEN